MAPSTWPALIVGAFTILNPSTPAGPTSAETPASTATLTTAQPTITLAQSLRGYTGQTFSFDGPLIGAGNGNGGNEYKPYPVIVQPGAVTIDLNAASKLDDLTSIDHMPNCWAGGDPNKMDAMCIWNGTDPNKLDPMAYGYDVNTKFYNSSRSATRYFGADKLSTSKDYLKDFSQWIPSPPPPPAVMPAPKDGKPQSFAVPPLPVPSIKVVRGATAIGVKP